MDAAHVRDKVSAARGSVPAAVYRAHVRQDASMANAVPRQELLGPGGVRAPRLWAHKGLGSRVRAHVGFKSYRPREDG